MPSKGDLEEELKKSIEGGVRFDTITKRAYSVDASIYEIEPLGVVTPKHKQDILTALRIADAFDVSIIPRGAATGITGGCIGEGLVLDFSVHLNRILKIDIEAELVVVEPGVVQDRLNAALSPFGYRLGPDTSTGNRATIGGMLANNAAGARSLRYGKMADHVVAVELALADGSLIKCTAVDDQLLEQKKRSTGVEGRIYREIDRIRKEYRRDIEEHFPKIPRRVTGYNLDFLIKPDPLNLSPLIAGSEGSLGIATEITLKISPKPKKTGLCLLHFHTLIEAMRTVPGMLEFNPLSLEMMDNRILEAGRKSPALHGKLEWLKGNPEALFIAEFDAATDESLAGKLKEFDAKMTEAGIAYEQKILTDPGQIDSVWALRKAGLGLLLSKRTYSRAIAFIEDISVAPEKLASFMEKFLAYLKSIGKEAGIYGHVGSGCMHIRPYMNLRNPEEQQLMHKIMEDVSLLLLEHGGALSGEHGDGFIRSWLNEKMFGPRLYKAFCELKDAFDPSGRMNPGKIVYPRPLLHDLRASESMQSLPTFLDFSATGGLELSVDLCNGNGLCRKGEGLMCPSFQATGDEYDSTRARAQALRAIVNKRLPLEAWTSREIYDVLDLCLECKGCKTECPSQVDMAKMKAEFLYHYQEKHGYSLRSRLFGHIGRVNQFLFPFRTLINAVGQSRWGRGLSSLFGIAPERSLPRIADERFSSWWQRRNTGRRAEKKVVLFNDTFNEFNHPEAGRAAVHVLEALGYEVIVPPWVCCGRPMISKGLLKQARAQAVRLLDLLLPYARQHMSIVGLEPSCILTIRDDFPDLTKGATELSVRCLTFDQFIQKHIVEGRLPLSFSEDDYTVKVHGHCHQKALTGTEATLEVLKCIPGASIEEINSGCCGMAGSFGYEKEHYAISMKIGGLKLFPAINTAKGDARIVADGFSCRSQIEHGTGRQAVHLAELLSERIK